jgi:hypothetical protein
MKRLDAALCIRSGCTGMRKSQITTLADLVPGMVTAAALPVSRRACPPRSGRCAICVDCAPQRTMRDDSPPAGGSAREREAAAHSVPRR